MNQKGLRIAYGALLFSSIVALSWFDYAAITALTNIGTDPAGRLVFKSASLGSGVGKSIYPFTYLAAAVSLVGITYYIYKAEKQWWAIPIGFLAARAATLGMINLYEQIFVVVGSDVWWRYYGKDWSTIMWTALGVVWVLTAVPWWQRKNFKPAAICFVSYMVVMFIWLLVGHPTVESGSAVAYLLNAASRLLSQATQVILVRR